MKSKESQDVLESFREQCSFLYPSFQSKEEMKAYYAQMNSFMNCGTPAPLSPKEGLKRLRRKLKQFSTVLRQLNSHEWGENIADIQTACGAFLMQKGEAFENKKEINKAISRHLEFIVRIAQNLYQLRQLQSLLEVHLLNVEALLKELEEVT